VRNFVVYGLGQLGQLFGAGALRAGVRVTPITRTTDQAEVWASVEEGTPILVGVGETQLHDVLLSIPAARRDHVMLVQNELFPKTWRAAEVSTPTNGIVWLSKKKGRPVEIARPSTLHGPHAAFFAELHDALDLPHETVDDAGLHRLLVAKFAFILGINTLGLVENLTLGAWLDKDESLVDAVLHDAVVLGQAHLEDQVDAAQAVAEAKEAMRNLAHYPAKGRTAAARLARALDDAEAMALQLEAFAKVAAQAS